MSWLDSLEEIRKKDWSKASPEEREAKAKEILEISAFASGTAALVPVPLIDLALFLPVHTALVMTVGHIYGRTLSKSEAGRIAAELGAVAGVTVAGRAAISVLKGFLPGLGGVIAAPAAFAMTWGLGRVVIAYFQDPATPKEHLKKVFDDAVAEGKKTFSREAFDRFRRRNPSGASEAADEPRNSGADAPDAALRSETESRGAGRPGSTRPGTDNRRSGSEPPGASTAQTGAPRPTEDSPEALTPNAARTRKRTL